MPAGAALGPDLILFVSNLIQLYQTIYNLSNFQTITKVDFCLFFCLDLLIRKIRGLFMNLGQKIEQLLKTTAMTKVELAKKLGLKDSSVISHWVKNRFKPDRANIAKLANVFKKPDSYFADDELYCAENATSYGLMERKVYELLSALPPAKRVGVQGEAEKDFFDLPLYSQAEEFLPIMLEGANTQPFAIKILNQAACPWANKDEYIICTSAEETQNGKLYLIKTPKGYTIKKVYIKQESTILKDYTGKTQTFKNKEIKIFARVLAFYRKAC